jgi:uncharacterized protein
MDPVSSRERVQLLDVLRGVAIFGMFTVNMTADLWWGESFREADVTLPDFVTIVFVDLFTNGKFITIFSFLFGIGFFVQMERASARGINTTLFYIRRSAGLLIIGVLAMACTVPSWILVDYAVFGLGLLLFRNRSPRTILTAAIVIILLGKVFGSIVPDYREYLESTAPVVEQSILAVDQADAATEKLQEEIMRDGTFLQVSSVMLLHLWESFSDWRYYPGDIDLLGIMLIGLYVARRGAVWDRDIRLSLARKTLPWLIGVGFVGCLVGVIMLNFGVGEKAPLLHLIIGSFAPWPIGMPLLGLGYVAAITLLFERESWRKWLTPLAAVGRMALSNYLFTGFVAAFISFSWGLGLYGEMSALVGMLLVLIIFPVQVVVSRWYMARFLFGPVEWLWRSFTYGALQPIRRAG